MSERTTREWVRGLRRQDYRGDWLESEDAAIAAWEADRKRIMELEEELQSLKTEHVLNKIRKWPYQDGWNELMEFIKPMWTYMFETEYMSGGKTQYTLATGGRSGNEDIISAMQRNYIFWSLCWKESNRGGQYRFIV